MSTTIPTKDIAEVITEFSKSKALLAEQLREQIREMLVQRDVITETIIQAGNMLALLKTEDAKDAALLAEIESRGTLYGVPIKPRLTQKLKLALGKKAYEAMKRHPKKQFRPSELEDLLGGFKMREIDEAWNEANPAMKIIRTGDKATTRYHVN